jgi:ribosomal subunit interface protein
MEIRVIGKQIDIGDALRECVQTRLNDGVSKYFSNSIDGNVTFSKDGPFFRVDCLIHIEHGARLRSHATANDIYAVFDTAADRMEKQMRRYKRRLISHHDSRKSSPPPGETVQSYVLAPEAEDVEAPESFQPVIIAEESADIPTLTVGEAVMRMDLADLPAKLFRNNAHNGLNMVYRRVDGNIGWVDPLGKAGSLQAAKPD